MSESLIVETEIDLGDVQARVETRINRRAKRLIVRVDSVRGTVHVTVPSRRSIPAALLFAQERSQWIRDELANGPKALPFAEGVVFPFQGIPHRIQRRGGMRSPVCRLEPADPGRLPTVNVGGDAGHTNRRVCDWLKHEARDLLTCRSDRYCDRLGVRRGKIRITDTRSRWGSCSENGTLSYNWAPDHGPG